MEAKELRIGNKIFFNKEIDTVSEISNAGHIFVEVNGFGNLDKGLIEPIPLTEEWLVRLGFKKKGEYFFLNELYASFDADRPMFLGTQGCCFVDTIKDGILYVHELQNLYFALTGEELTEI